MSKMDCICPDKETDSSEPQTETSGGIATITQATHPSPHPALAL